MFVQAAVRLYMEPVAAFIGGAAVGNGA